MKIIDLLIKIANGNIPKRIIYNEYVYAWDNKIENYEREIDPLTTLNWDYIAINCLNEPVEIIEEEKKIPEKWNDFSFTTMRNQDDIEHLKGYIETIMRTQNEIIDYLKSKGE